MSSAYRSPELQVIDSFRRQRSRIQSELHRLGHCASSPPKTQQRQTQGFAPTSAFVWVHSCTPRRDIFYLRLIMLKRPTRLYTIQVTALLDVPTVSGDNSVGQPQKPPFIYAGYFQGIEVLPANLL